MHQFVHGDHIADTGFVAPIDLALLTVDQIEERDYIDLHADIRETSEVFLYLYRQAKSDQLYFSISKSWTKAPLAIFNEEVGAWGFPELSESLNGNTYTSSSIRIKRA